MIRDIAALTNPNIPFPLSRDYRRVPGLRDYAPNSDVRVYNAAGELLRVVPDEQLKLQFIPRDLRYLPRQGTK